MTSSRETEKPDLKECSIPWNTSGSGNNTSKLARTTFGSPSYPSPLDRIRGTGKRERAAKLGIEVLQQEQYEANQSFPGVGSRAPGEETVLPKLEDFRGDGADDVCFSASYNAGTFAEQPSSWAPVNDLNSSLGHSLGHSLPLRMGGLSLNDGPTSLSEECASLGLGSSFLGGSWSFYNYIGTDDDNIMYPTSVRNPNKAVCTVNARTTEILVANDICCELFQYSKSELIGMSLSALVKLKHRDRSAVSETFIDDVGKLVQISGKVLDAVDSTGLVLPVSVWMKQLPSDVTDLENDVAKDDSVDPRCIVIMEPVEHTTVQVTVDGDGTILNCDQQFVILFGFPSSDDVKGQDVTSLLTLKLKDGKISEDKSKQSCTGRRRDGTAFPCSARVRAAESPPGTFEVVVYVFANISGLVTFLPDGVVHSCNHYFALSLLGYAHDEVLGKPITLMLPDFYDEVDMENDDMPLPPIEGDEVLEAEDIVDRYSPIEDELLAEKALMENPDDIFEKPEIMEPDSEKENRDANIQNPSVENKEKAGPMDRILSEARPSTPLSDNKCDCCATPKRKFPCRDVLSSTPAAVRPPKIADKIQDKIQECRPKSIPEGNFAGQVQHKNGDLLSVVYQIKRLALEGGETLYAMWMCRNPDDPALMSTRATSFCSTLNQSRTSMGLHRDLSRVCESPLPCQPIPEHREIDLDSSEHLSQQLDDVTSETDDVIERGYLTPGRYEDFYETREKIGKGAFGFVKLGRRISDGKDVVVKFIRKAKVLSECWVDTKQGKVPLELSLLTTLSHPNIVSLLGAFESDEFFHLVMDKHGQGMDLFEFIDRYPNLDEPLISYMFRQMVDAVDYLHELGIIHRDVKDENIILDQKFHVKLIDFGSAAFMEEGKVFGTFCGTVEYCSPEVLMGNKYRGPELEMWSLGVTLYTLVFGENPFYDVDETIQAVLKPPFQVSVALMHVIGWLLSRDPAKRATTRDMKRHLWVTQPVNIDHYDFENVLPNYEFHGNVASDNRPDDSMDHQAMNARGNAPKARGEEVGVAVEARQENGSGDAGEACQDTDELLNELERCLYLDDKAAMDPLMQDDLGALFFGSNPLFDDPTPASKKPTNPAPDNPAPDNPKPAGRRKEPEKGKRKRRMSSDLAIVIASEVIDSPNSAPAEELVTQNMENPLPQMRRSSRIRRKSIEFGRKQYLPQPMIETLDTSENGEVESVTKSSEEENKELVTEKSVGAGNTGNYNNNNASIIIDSESTSAEPTKTPANENTDRCYVSDNSDDEQPDEKIKMLYLNKNFKWPTPKSWTTIFEQPQVSKTGQDSLTFGKRKVKRSIDFDTMTVVKLKKRLRKGSQNGWKKRRVSIARDRDMQDRIDRLDDIILGNVGVKSENTTPPVIESGSKAPASKKPRTARRVQRVVKKALPSLSEEATLNEIAVPSVSKVASIDNTEILAIPLYRTPTPPLPSESVVSPSTNASIAEGNHITDIVDEQPQILEPVPDTVSKRRGRGRKPESKTLTLGNQNQLHEPKTGATEMNIVENRKVTIASEVGENNDNDAGRVPKDRAVGVGNKPTNSAILEVVGSPEPPKKKRKRGKRASKKKQKFCGNDFSEDQAESIERKDSAISDDAKVDSNSSEMIAAEQKETENIPSEIGMEENVSERARTVEIEVKKSESSVDPTRRSMDEEMPTSGSERSVSRSSLEKMESVSRSSTEKSELSIKLFENDPSLNSSSGLTDSWMLRSKTPNETESATISEMVTNENNITNECSRDNSHVIPVDGISELSADSLRENDGNEVSTTRDSTEMSQSSEIASTSEMTDSATTNFQKSDFEMSESHDISSRTMSPAFDASVRRESTISLDGSSVVENSDPETVNNASLSNVENQKDCLDGDVNDLKSLESKQKDVFPQTPCISLQASNSSDESIPSTSTGPKPDILKTPLVTQADPFTTPLTSNRLRPESPEIAASYLNKLALFSALFSKS